MNTKPTTYLIFVISIFLLFNCTDNKVKENEVIARDFIEACSTHDIDKAISLFAENCLYEEVARGRKFTNREEIAGYLNGTISGIPDTQFDIVTIIANDSSAMVEWIWKGTNTVGWTNIPATDKYFELRGISVLSIENNLIKKNIEYWDWNSFLKGLGIE
jgi:steroid delta-isomerase-like uncharacterized protein